MKNKILFFFVFCFFSLSLAMQCKNEEKQNEDGTPTKQNNKI